MAKTERIPSRNQRERDEAETLITELEKGLRIDQNALDEALEQQPDLFYRVSKLLTLETSRRDAIKQEMQEIEAECDERVRITAERLKDKLTETEAKMRVRLDPKMKGITQDLLRANRKVGELAALKEAFQQRSYVIKDLVSLYVANYFSDSSGARSSGSMKDRLADETKRSAAQQRREWRRDT